MLLLFPMLNYMSASYEYYTIVPTEDDVVRLYVLSSLGVIVFISAYVLSGLVMPVGFMRAISDKYSRFVLPVFLHRPTILFFLFLVSVSTLWSMAYGYFGLTNRDSEDVGYSAGVIGVISSLLAYVNIILWSNFFQISKEKQSVFLPGLSLFLLLIFALFANSKGALIFPFVQVVLAYYFARKRMPFLAISVLVVFFLVLAYPVVQGFRYAVYFDLSDKTPSSFILALADYFLSFAWLDPAATPEGERSLTFGRGLFSYLAYIFKQAGEAVPYLNGSTYYEGIENFIPRILLPEKVDMSTGHWTGQLFDHVSLSDSITNVSPTYMGEFYMNNGTLGLVIGMGLLGVFSRFIDEVIFKASGNWLKVLFVLNILWLEAFVGTTFLVFIKTFLTFVVCVYILSIVGRRASAR